MRQPLWGVLRGLLVGHGFVGYGSCSRPCPTSRRGGGPISSRRSPMRSRGASMLLDVHSDADHHRSVFTLAGARRRSSTPVAGHRGRDRAHRPPRARRRAPPRGRRRRRPARAASLRRDAASDAAAREPRCACRIRARASGLPIHGEVGGGQATGPIFRRGGLDELRARVDDGELVPDEGPREIDPRRVRCSSELGMC